MTAQFGRTGMPHDLRAACRWMQARNAISRGGRDENFREHNQTLSTFVSQKERVHADRLRNSLFQACQPVKPRTI